MDHFLTRLAIYGLALLVLPNFAIATVSARVLPISFEENIVAEIGGMHNVRVRYNTPLSGHLAILYGSCAARNPDECQYALGETHVGNHPLAKKHLEHPSQLPERFVWLPSSATTSGGCLLAFSDDRLVGRSAPVIVTRRKARRGISIADIVDSEGPWFDGVAYLKAKEPDQIFVAAAKSKTVGILGGGMSGLMTAKLLDSIGIRGWKIIEASMRIGGRVHTSYLNGTRPEDYQYQEMGPMRFPVSVRYAQTNETFQIQDHRLVFQLADELNKWNRNNSRYAVNFIPWFQNTPNTPADTPARRPDGTIPGNTEVKQNPAYQTNPNATYSNATAVAEAQAAYSNWTDLDGDRISLFAKNVFLAHKQAVEEGYFDYSESGYLKYKLGIDPNITDQVDSLGDNDPTWLYDTVYFSATEWRTIDKGLSRLPIAFGPQVLNRTIFNTTVQGMSWNHTTGKMSVLYRKMDLYETTPESMKFDYAVVAVPFSRVRLWRLPEYSSLLSRAINTLNYEQSCKVALHYKSRFWEHLDYPIRGGCGATNIPGIGSICYPSYAINKTQPGVILASYQSGTLARSLGAMTEKQHVALVQRAMVETHGEIAAREYTGKHDRICWELNEFQAGAWAAPTVGQQDLYLPAYFQTEKNTVFVGEHTSYTHAWIWSALESAVRGTAQLLLDMGLVDEAKEITTFWMARWIHM